MVAVFTSKVWTTGVLVSGAGMNDVHPMAEGRDGVLGITAYNLFHLWTFWESHFLWISTLKSFPWGILQNFKKEFISKVSFWTFL